MTTEEAVTLLKRTMPKGNNAIEIMLREALDKGKLRKKGDFIC